MTHVLLATIRFRSQRHLSRNYGRGRRSAMANRECFQFTKDQFRGLRSSLMDGLASPSLWSWLCCVIKLNLWENIFLLTSRLCVQAVRGVLVRLGLAELRRWVWRLLLAPGLLDDLPLVFWRRDIALVSHHYFQSRSSSLKLSTTVVHRRDALFRSPVSSMTSTISLA